ncbi:D-glucuronate isomerase [Alkalibacterium putridalgicola]|uniref:Uronate isomerase n=1 Tax=Alkalibacterium putridalgicola TaxID=426703 RepID=A0A1H7U2Z5_9LACT|nr:glucuronate isomerase [Alkalibacterium putridalgicola]GEK89497.1 uronate isomerase [Alkalibacterium putridalgicola]SEL91046.1 D-glucuronate isomerase [Alkalibacterium putridalgicola]
MTFIHDDFMLQNDVAKHLYHDYAKDLPIFDYHCHLDPKQIAEDHQFENLTELWLAGDHYKWRAMRANGVSEDKVTGDASPEEKFEAWAGTAEVAIGNPLFHWTQLELKKYFGIEDLLTSENWKDVYDRANTKLRDEGLTARKLVENSNVAFIGTTDNPTDSLEYHDQIKADDSFDVTVAPSFRPDEAFAIGEEKFTNFLNKLKDVTGKTAESYAELVALLEERVEYFDQRGTLASDHGLTELLYAEATDEEIDAIYVKALAEKEVTKEEKAKYLTRLLTDLSAMYEKRGWIMQIHFGAIRNNNARSFEAIGPDAGFDSINDQTDVAYALNNLLNSMHKNGTLPKTIVYNLNPMYNHIVASTVANFQGNDEGIKGKVQFGAGWWFNDTEQGMLRQMETLADHGLLMHFVGMLTDSRSFVSYPRHDYFRRILCNFVGEQVELGKFPNDENLLKKLIENVSYNNAIEYFKK